MDSDGGGEGGRSAANSREQFIESGGNHHDNHRHYFSGVSIKIMLLFMAVGIVIICLVVNRSAYPAQFIGSSYSFKGPKDGSESGKLSSPSCASSPVNQFTSENLPSPANEENNLENTLKKAAMKDNKTVIITALNAAWTEPNSIFDLFLESFRIGNRTENLLNHVVVVALDKKAYSRCLEVHHHCYALTTPGVDFSGEAFYMTKDYLKMMWRRTDFLRIVLETGYNFIFTDADIMWLRDPFERFYPDGDFQIACDHYWYNYTDLNNSPNGGFKYVKSNERTIQFYKFWNAGKNYFPGKNEQDVLNIIKFYPLIQEIGLEIRFLDTAYFGGFCEPSKDLDLAITMHANCCIGLDNKIHDIKMVIDDWKRYMSSRDRNLTTRSWTVPRICG